jgi:hypothetical protein
MLMQKETMLGNTRTLLLLVFFMEELSIYMLVVMTVIFMLAMHIQPTLTVTPMATT